MLLYLQQVLLFAVALGFGLIFWSFIRTGIFWRSPFFACYSACASLYGVLYDPYNTTLMFTAQPILLSLKISMAIEAFILATETISPIEKRWALLASVAPTVAVILIVGFLRFHAGDSSLDWYHAARLYTHIGVAAGCVFGALTLWIEPPKMTSSVKAHCLTLICYFLSHAIINFGMPANSLEWQYLSCVSLAAVCVCIWYWLRCGLTSGFRSYQTFQVFKPLA